MKITLKIATIIFASTFLLVHAGFAQKNTISGYVKDARNGEALIGVNIYQRNTASGTVSNAYGFYSLSMLPGNYHIMISYVGYQVMDTLINLSSDVTMNFELIEMAKMINEVVIQSKESRENIESTRMSVVSLSGKTMKQIPVAFGEVDIMKILTFLPGVKSNDEGGSAISVRGGARDQNMILLDEATVYNASHLGNLLSVFNDDAIQNVEFYKGNIPAQYGGRLSSLIDIRMKEGNHKRVSATGGIGTLASRLTLEVPIVKGKGSFMISGRRAYIDLLTKAMHAIKDTFPIVPYYFYDLNLKANYSINDKNKLFVFGYFGKDVFNMKDTVSNIKNNYSWGNYTGTIRWNSLLSNKIFTNFTLLVSNYNYDFKNEWEFGKDRIQQFDWTAFIKDYSFKYDLGYYLNDKVTIKTGFITTYHDFDLGKVNGSLDTMKFKFAMPNNYSFEHALYIACEHKFSPKLTINYGLRYTLFQSIGKATVYKLDANYETVDTLRYGKGKVFNYYQNLEPRIGIAYSLNENSSLKLGYSRTSQYVHIVSNSSVASLIDVWIGSGPNIKPQSANLYSAGYFKNFPGDKIEASIEVYYKDMKNQIEFKEFAQPQFNQRIDEDFRFGIGRSYGAEIFIRKSEGRLNGWISYTYSKTEQKTQGIQEKGWYLSSFDRPHDLSVVGMYNLSKRFSVSANFTIKSGRPFTSPVLKYDYQQTVIPYFDKRNNDRMPLYHRLDLSVALHSKDKPNRKFRSEIVLSVFDVYNHVNPVAIYFKSNEDQPQITHAYKQNFMGFTPSLTWNFSF
jgi:hypothetical protein